MKPKESESSNLKENAARLRCARKSQGLAVARASDLLGVSPATLKRWESGSGTPGSHTIEKILDCWGVASNSSLRAGSFTENVAHRCSWSLERGETRPVLRFLRHRRRRNRLSFEEISRVTGVGIASLQRYETGLRVPNQEILQSVAGAVGCSATEADVLQRALANEEASPEPLELSQLFTSPNGHPSLLIFRELDYLSRFHRTQSPSEVGSRFRSIMFGLAFSGDYAALLEAWRESRSFIQQDRSINPFKSLIAMAKMHLARRPREAEADFLLIRKGIKHAPRTSEDINTIFSAIRMAQMLGDYEDADFMLNILENDTEFVKVGKISCAVYRHLLDYGLGKGSDAIDRLADLQKDASPVLSYTALVAQLDIQVKMGARADAAETLARCRTTERTYGVGSPLARRLGAALLMA